jgi:hypothetical protein
MRFFGDLVFSSGMTVGSLGGTLTFAKTSGTQTITSAGQTIDQAVTIDAPGATVSLQDALTLGSTRTLTLTNGTLTTNGYAVTTGLFSSSNANVRTLNLGASTVTITGTGTAWNITDPTNMTLNAGTSSLVFTGTSSAISFSNGGLTYYNITAPNSLFSFTIISSLVCNNFTATNTSAGEKFIRWPATASTVNGALALTGSSGNCRVFINAVTLGTATTITANSVSLSDVDFRDITAAGAAISWTGTRLGNSGGNTNITFAAAKTVYWNLPVGGAWTDTAWALTSGGVAATTNQPLPQDTEIFNDVGINSGSVVTFDSPLQIGTLNCSALTNLITFSLISTYGNPNFNGSVTLNSAVTVSTPSTGIFNFAQRGGTQVITTTGAVISCSILFASTNSQLVGSITTPGTCTLAYGQVDLNATTFTCGIFNGNTSITRSIAFNGGNISVTGNSATVWECSDLTAFSYTGTPTVNFTYSGSTGTRTVSNGNTAGATESNVVDFNIVAGSDAFTFGSNASVRNLTVQPAYSGVGFSLVTSGFIYGNLLLSPSLAITSSANSTTFAATSGTKTITTNGVAIDRTLLFDGIGGSWALQDAITVGGTRTLQLYAGTLTTNGYAVTVGKFGGSTVTGNRTLNLGASVFTCTGESTTQTAQWQVVDGGFSYTVNAGTSTIYMAEAFTGVTTQNFIGGGKTYYNVVFSGGQPGGFFDSNTFNSISNTTQPLTLSFEAGTTQTVNNFNISGTAGNLVTLNSVTPGTQWGLAKNTGGKVLVSYVSITDSAATPAGYWFAPTSQGNVNGGNNTGWNFGTVGGAGGFIPFF